MQLPRSIIEFYYKNDALNDPMVSRGAHHRVRLGRRRRRSTRSWRWRCASTTSSSACSSASASASSTSRSSSAACGRTSRCASCWPTRSARTAAACGTSATSDKLDKDRFRRDLGGVLEAYQEVARRLGVLTENRPAQGQRPGAGRSNPQLKQTELRMEGVGSSGVGSEGATVVARLHCPLATPHSLGNT